MKIMHYVFPKLNFFFRFSLLCSNVMNLNVTTENAFVVLLPSKNNENLWNVTHKDLSRTNEEEFSKTIWRKKKNNKAALTTF